MNLSKPICLFTLLLLAINAKAQLIDTLIEVRANHLHFKILQGKQPPVLFESGGGLDASQWDSIAMVLHQCLDATIITYDRAGFGKSSLDTANYNILEEVKNLELGLEHFGYLNANFLLVGHSLGSFYNRVFAARHPNKVKGIVLLDPRLPSPGDIKFARDYFHTLDRKDFEPGFMSLYCLLANMEHTSKYTRQVPMPTHIPILVIMAETGPFEQATENERFKADQHHFVEAHKNRKLLLAEGSSHNIPHDKPGLVIEQIIEFYQRHIIHSASSSLGSTKQPSQPGN
jgi:pimeloyl-ACP methyl ester carboxylesterase